MKNKYFGHIRKLSTNILISVIVLFVFCIIFAGFHFYSRWFLVRRSRNHRRRRFSFASIDATTNPSATPKALAPFVLKSLPTFLYSAAHDYPPLECVVCLSEFEDNGTGRILPKCNHTFHVACIDMGLLSHSNCPLCRAPIELPHNLGHRSGNPPETIVTVVESVTFGLRYGDESHFSSNRSNHHPHNNSDPEFDDYPDPDSNSSKPDPTQIQSNKENSNPESKKKESVEVFLLPITVQKFKWWADELDATETETEATGSLSCPG